MKLFTAKADVSGKRAALDDMILTKAMPTAAGSKMLCGYMSLFDATVIDKLSVAGYAVCGKANVGEMGIDLMGETSVYGACKDENGNLTLAAAEIVKSGEADIAITLDVNGSNIRAAAQKGLVYVKPTYGTVSRFGTVPAACSGDTVGVMAATVSEAKNGVCAIAGYDEKDGTMHSDELCRKVSEPSAPAKRVAVISDMRADTSALEASGIPFDVIDAPELKLAKNAWNILMCSELCNNVSRYDGIKYGHRCESYKTIDELYTNSRTEAFGDLLKTAILFGSDNLSDDNYIKAYDKALRVRRVISERLAQIFEQYDAVLLPACSKMSYTEDDVKSNPYISFDENVYTAPASITGMPSVTVRGVQLVGKAFSENMLLATAELLEKEGVVR